MITDPRLPVVSDVISLPTVPRCDLLLQSSESVAAEIVAWAKRRIMKKPIDEKELESLLQAAKAAGEAIGYARARFEMALERAKEVVEAPNPAAEAAPVEDLKAKTEKLETLKVQADKAEKETSYKTRQTVSMTKQVALDYLKNAAPRIVGPSEIIKNSQKTLGVFISFGTLNRAMAALIEAGDVEELERSRWKYKGSATLRSVK
jgi:hypothetical protein